MVLFWQHYLNKRIEMVKLDFTTISPLHISNGTELAQNLHYIINEKKFHKINYQIFCTQLAKNNLLDFNKDYSIDVITRLIENSKINIAKDYSEYSISYSHSFATHLGKEKRLGMTYVQDFVNSANKFYIPASSVKGALLTILKLDSLGIKESIHEKFVINDSSYIDNNNFQIYRTCNRPPEINLIAMKRNIKFSLILSKLGTLSVSTLTKSLAEYSKNQISKAKGTVLKFKSKREIGNGADQYFKILTELSNIQLDNHEYLINIGFGGGSWFKIFSDVNPPVFKNPGKKFRVSEEAHTTFSVLEDNQLYQLGWCKLKIIE